MTLKINNIEKIICYDQIMVHICNSINKKSFSFDLNGEN